MFESCRPCQLMNEEMKAAAEEVLRLGSEIEEESRLMLSDAEGVKDPELRAAVADVARETMSHRWDAANAVLDAMNGRDGGASAAEVRILADLMREFKKEMGVLRGILRA